MWSRPGGAVPALSSFTLGRADPATLKYGRLTLDNGVQFDVAVDGRRFDPIIRAVAEGGRNRWILDCFYPLLDLMRPGDRALDLRGHIGTFALAAAALGCRTVCVEAAPENVALLNASVARNGFKRLLVVHAAATDRPGTLEFLPHGPWGTISNPTALSSPDSINAAEHAAVLVPAVAADALLRKLGWNEANFLKIDIEGSEIGAIRGMRQLLARSDWLIVFYESNGHALRFFGETLSRLMATLYELGYSSYIVEPGRFVPVQPGDFQPECVINYLAVKGAHPRLREWKFARPRSLEDTISKTIRECSHEIWFHRAYIARVIPEAPAPIASDARVLAAVRALRRDSDERVRAATDWARDQTR